MSSEVTMISSPGPVNSDVQDFGAIAGFYSQLAGVLAGFAFAGLIALVAAQLTSGNRAGVALQSFAPLISSLIGLIASSLNYAIISGEGRHTERGAALETIGGLGFCVAGLMLFYSILVLLHGVSSDAAATGSDWRTVIVNKTITLVRSFINLGLVPLVIFLLYGGVTDQEVFRYGAASGFHWLDYLGFGLVITSAIIGGMCLVLVRSKNMAPYGSEAIVLTLCVCTIAISLLSVAGTSIVLIFMEHASNGPEWLAAAELITLALLATCLSYSTAQFRAMDRSSSTPPQNESPATTFKLNGWPQSRSTTAAVRLGTMLLAFAIGCLVGLVRSSRRRYGGRA